MSLKNCIAKANSGKAEVFSADEIKQLEVLHLKAMKDGVSVDDAARNAVQELLDEAISAQRAISDAIASSLGLEIPDNNAAKPANTANIKPAEPEFKQGEVGGKLSPDEVVLTATGRQTTPFPTGRTDTNRTTASTVKKIDKWLIDNAIAEAKARNDDFNLTQFSGINVKSPSQSDKDSAELYLFHTEQPKVLAPLLKPMNMAGVVRVERPKSNPTPQFESLHPKSQEKFNAAWEAQNISAMQEYLDPSNKGLRAEFESRAGIKLPNTIKGTDKAVSDYFSQPIKPVGVSKEVFKGDRFTDAKGNLFEVWNARTGHIEAFPVVNGKMKVSRDTGQFFATNEWARSAFPDARTDFNPIEKVKNNIVTPQIISDSHADSIISASADSVKTLRKADVGRVLDETPANLKLSMAQYLKDNRRDLEDEVNAVMADGAKSEEKSSKSVPDHIGSDDKAAIEKANADFDFDDALSDLGDILGKNFRATITPEQEQKLLPVLVKLFDAAFRKGYYKFKDAARFVLDTIEAKLGKEVADEITIDHLQSGYIGMSGRYREQGADKARDVVLVESKSDLGGEYVNDQRSSTHLERDSENIPTQNGVGAQDIRDERGSDGGSGESGVSEAQSEGWAGSSGLVHGHAATPIGEHSNFSLFTGSPGGAASIARDSVNQRSDSIGIEGTPIESDATSIAEELAESGVSLEQAKKQQAEADKKEHKPGLENIRLTLPILHAGQQEDVQIAETRFAKPEGYGMLFTNGTGTGKTFSGLGIAKRMVLAGKGNIIITAPSDKIADDWKTAGTLLGLNITRLEDTKSSGTGIVITTYANFGQNNELAKRDWDLIIHDEAHYLAMDKDGTNTLALKTLRAISLHPDGAYTRAHMIHADLVQQIDTLSNQAKMMRVSDNQEEWHAAGAVQAKADKLSKEFTEKLDAIKKDISERQGEKRPRALFLSATPFAYEKTIDWANGYLFDYNEGRGSVNESRGYNAGSNSDQFMIHHFGYRMRYGKLTRPDAKVDTGIMQRQFNSWLKKQGVLSGRMLDVDADYDRKFILVDSAIGTRIDKALEWFSEQRDAIKGEDKQRIAALHDVEKLIADKFDYLSRRYLLEAIKAKEVIPHVREHMAMGRKVVVFHDYKKGGGFNPFDLTALRRGEQFTASGDTDKINDIIAEFRAEFKDLIESDVWRASSPITAFKQAFPNVLLFNGDISKMQRRANVEYFQSDDSGVQVILVQSAAGKEGISLHDTSGKHQRVLFNLGQPTQPTTAMQQEGRTYRTGQVTDAIFRYLNTGTNWEKWAFATTIAQRASAAENLAMGEQARALKDAFIEGFEESDDYRAGMEGEGKGGKERDRAANNALTEYDRARAFYFGTQKKNSRTKAQEGADYFATPEPVGLKMVELADIRAGESALEPSAGHGAIARWIPDHAEKTAIEPSMALRPRLAMVFDGKIIDSQFEDLSVVNKYDAIIMNPPFGSAGRTAIDHVAKAATHLRDGGRIVALIPVGSTDQKFDKWFYEKAVRDIKPLAIHPTLGAIYKGDTISSRLAGADKVIAVSAKDNGIMFSLKGSSFSTLTSMQGIYDIEPTGKRYAEYNPAEGLHLVAEIKLPSVTFERAGTKVNARIVVIEKSSESSATMAQRDYTDVADINELFDRMETLSISPRAKPVVEESGAAAFMSGGRGAKLPNATAVKDASAREAEKAAQDAGLIADDNSKATFEIRGDKLITNAPAEKVTKANGGILEGVFVPNGQFSYAQIKAIDKWTYSPGGKSKGLFVRLRHVERPSAPDIEEPKFSKRSSHQDAATFSKSSEKTENPYTVESIKQPIIDAFEGKLKSAVQAMLDNGKLKIVTNAEAQKIFKDELPDFTTEGFYNPADKTSYLIADNLSQNLKPEQLKGLVLHEVGVHAMKLGRDSQEFKAILKQVELMRKLGNENVIKAYNSIPDDTLPQHVNEETLAYLVQKNPSLKISQQFFAWFRNVLRAIGKLFTVTARLKWVAGANELTQDDLVYMAHRAMLQRENFSVPSEGLPLFSKSKPTESSQSASEIIPDETELQKRQRQVQDKMNRFKVLQDWVKEQGVPLTEKSDVHTMENLMHSKVANRTEDFRERTIAPLIERAAKAGFNLVDIADYLEAQHIPEANARIAMLHKDESKTANGITTEEAKAALAEFEAMPNFQTFKAIADEFQKVGEVTLALRLGEGMISREQYDAYKATFKNWVPLRGDGTGKRQSVGKGLSVNAKEKRRLGHGAREDGEHIIENLLLDRERAIYQIEHNRVVKSIIQFALEAQQPDLITVNKPVKRQVLKESSAYEVQYKGRMVRAFSSESDAKAFINQSIALTAQNPGGGMGRSNFAIEHSYDPTVIMQASPLLAENEIQGYVAGHTIRIQLNDELLARAATNMGVDQLNMLLSAARSINTGLSKIYTAYSPDFILRNAIRDGIAGTINLTGDLGVKMAAKIYTAYPRAIRELLKARNDPRLSDMVQRYRAAGGNTGAAYLSDIERVGKDATKVLREHMATTKLYKEVYAKRIAEGRNAIWAHTSAAMTTGLAKYGSIPLIGHFLTLIEHLNAVTENALRLATFTTLANNGYSEQSAAAAAKNSTVNFNRKGEISNVAGSLYLFFNPAVQGSARMFGTLLRSEHKVQAQALSGMLAMAAFTLAEIARGYGDDDDKEATWKAIPDYVKDHNMIFSAGDMQITIPVPYEFAPFHALGIAISDASHGESYWKASSRVFKSLLNNLMPMGDPYTGDTADGVNINQIEPTLMKMVMAPRMNENTFGAPIQPEKNQYTQNKPDSQNMFRGTKGTVYSGAAEWVNSATGGDQYHAGSVDVSPEVLRYWVTSLTGGAGRFVVDSISSTYGLTQGVSPEMKSIPIARVLVREAGVNDSRSRFWEAAKEAKLSADAFAMAKKARDAGSAIKIKDSELDMILLSKMADKFGKAAAAKRDAIDAIRMDDSILLESKQEQMKAIEKEEQAYYDKFLKMFDARKK